MAITKTSKKSINQDRVVSGSFRDAFKKHSQKLRFVTIATAIIVVLIVVGIVWLINRNDNKQAAIQLSNSKLSALQLTQEVSQLESQGNNAEAQQLINNQAGNAQSETDQILQAQNDVKVGKIQEALTIEENAGTKDGLTESLAQNIASLATQLKQTKVAISYYNQAITILQSQPASPILKGDIPYLQAKIKSLQSQ